MIDVIVERNNHKKRVVCHKCGSELAYSDEDRLEKEVDIYKYIKINSIECPICGEIINVGEK